MATDQADMLKLLEDGLRRALAVPHPSLQQFYGMMHYHLGWLDRSLRVSAEQPRGKRLRPLLALLSCQAAGGEMRQALPAAVAVELIHDFSLVHDDIEDRSDFRRHREAVWKLWGDAHAVNVGDALFALARTQLQGLLDEGVSPRRVLGVFNAFDSACLALTEGQFLDMRFESMQSVELDEYLWMIRGKTAALIACACETGALTATDDCETIRVFHDFGYNLGMAFQIEDDLLGVWGDPDVTGKPAGDDIMNRKKTLPVVCVWTDGLLPGATESVRAAAGTLTQVYREPRKLSTADASRIAEMLDSVGARRYCESMSRQYTSQAMSALSHPALSQQAVRELRTLAESLLGRAS